MKYSQYNIHKETKMRKAIKTLIGLSLASTIGITAGTIRDDAVGINLGGTATKTDKSIKLDNFSVGLTYQFNEFSDSHVKPRVDVDYVSLKNGSIVNALYKGSINGVYEFAVTKKLSPYLLAGLGYEHVDRPIDGVFDSHPFSQAGAGVSYRPGDGYNVQVESRLLQIHGGGDKQNNEVMLTAGLSVPIGDLNKDECPIKIDGPDQDRDGVLDSMDQCPDTPCYFTVDQYGCPINGTLRIHFDFDKATIRPISMPKVIDFAKFLRTNPGTTVKIIGHTDAIGSDEYNMGLSLRRAESVRVKLIELGVSQYRLSSAGMGERMPVASNATDEGRALNRRIEVQLTYIKKKEQ